METSRYLDNISSKCWMYGSENTNNKNSTFSNYNIFIVTDEHDLVENTCTTYFWIPCIQVTWNFADLVIIIQIKILLCIQNNNKEYVEQLYIFAASGVKIFSNYGIRI